MASDQYQNDDERIQDKLKQKLGMKLEPMTHTYI